MISIMIIGIFIIAFSWTLFFLECRAWLITALVGVLLFCFTLAPQFSKTGLIILWIIWLIPALFIFIRPLRISLLIKPFFHWFKKQNPKLSLAEQQVIDAGGQWWGNALFKGARDWEKVLSRPAPALTTVEKKFLNETVTELCNAVDEWRISHCDHDLPAAAWDIIKSRGFWALEIDPCYGGHGFSPAAHSAIIAKIASRSYSTAISVMVPNSLGPAEFLKYFGTQAQKDYYLPRLACGTEIPCFALTSIEFGSDAASITDYGVVCHGQYNGKNTLGIRLNWNKRYITLAPIATLIGVAFHLYDPEHWLGEQEDIGITLALVPADLPGIEKGMRHIPLQMGFMNGPLRGRDVFIPCEQIIGGIEKRGQGWKMMMECLALGRGVSLPSVATAITQFCTQVSCAYSAVRQQFRRPIKRFEGIQQVLGRMGGLAYLSEAMRMFTLEEIQLGQRPAVGSAIAKYYLTEFARQAVADSMDIHGGHGIIIGPQNYLSFLHQAAPINITVEGANIMTRGLIIFGQGILRCHPFLRQELQAATENNLYLFDNLICRHIGFFISQFARLVIYGITGARWVGGKLPQLSRMINAFVVLGDLTLFISGKKLKSQEAHSGRMGEVLSYLCMIVSLLKSYQGRGSPADETIFLDWGIQFCFNKIQSFLKEIFANFPTPWLGKLMRRLIFPWGTPYPGPQDSLIFEIAHNLCTNTNLRERICQHCYFVPHSAVWQLQKAMKAMQKVAPLLNKIIVHHNMTTPCSPFESYFVGIIKTAHKNGFINQSEYEQLQNAIDLYWQVLQADEFSTGSFC